MTRCPNCGGGMIIIDARAWCVCPYRDGGCAGFWVLKGGVWVRQAWHKPLLVQDSQIVA